MDVAEALDSTAGKRKRSPSSSSLPSAAPPAKTLKSPGHQLSINYLARHAQDDLPLLNQDDTLPNLLHLLSQYSSVLDRHESLASNLGARPLGPILIKRFERCFDGPPKVVASHHKGSAGNPDDAAHSISWLEVIEFARAHPTQFTLTTFSEGRRVCQFYYPQKQLRVQISEEDFLFINSGRCQELIPPLPIWEDEEKEVATCAVLEAKLKELTNVADMVAARTRQLGHRLKGRRAAILDRRAEGGSGTPAKASAVAPTAAPSSSSLGFTAVNFAGIKSHADAEPAPGSMDAVRAELLRHFESLPQNQGHARPVSRHQSIAVAHHSASETLRHAESGQAGEAGAERARSDDASLSPVPPHAFADAGLLSNSLPGAPGGLRASTSMPGPGFSYTPLKHNFSRPLPPALESSQPFRPLCQAHMDSVPRGHRVVPPCDRCRRLRMDCIKNLTSCAGCTKKHARCHWRDVTRDELGALDHLMDADAIDRSISPKADGTQHGVNGSYLGLRGDYEDEDDPSKEESDDDDSNPLEDLEALEEREEREQAIADRTREDEDGLRQAKELAKQARDDGLPTSALPAPHEMITGDINVNLEEPPGAESAPFDIERAKVNGDDVDRPCHSLEKRTSIHPSDALLYTEDAKPADKQCADGASNTSFVPIAGHNYPFSPPSSHGGFRAVNDS